MGKGMSAANKKQYNTHHVQLQQPTGGRRPLPGKGAAGQGASWVVGNWGGVMGLGRSLGKVGVCLGTGWGRLTIIQFLSSPRVIVPTHTHWGPQLCGGLEIKWGGVWVKSPNVPSHLGNFLHCGVSHRGLGQCHTRTPPGTTGGQSHNTTMPAISRLICLERLPGLGLGITGSKARAGAARSGKQHNNSSWGRWGFTAQ